MGITLGDQVRVKDGNNDGIVLDILLFAMGLRYFVRLNGHEHTLMFAEDELILVDPPDDDFIRLYYF